jgi:hypothetical protein
VRAVSAGQRATRPNRSAELIDLLRAAGVPFDLSARDHAAVKASRLTPRQIAAAYGAAYRGEWGDPWLRDNLCVRLVIERWAGYQARLNGHPAALADGHGPLALVGAQDPGGDRFAAFEKYG